MRAARSRRLSGDGVITDGIISLESGQTHSWRRDVAKLGRSMLRPYKFSGLVFGPAEAREGLLEAGDGEADDVEVAAFDAGNIAPGAALDGVGASLIVGFAGREVAGNFSSGERGKVHQRGLDEGKPLGVGKADEGDTGDD